MKTLSLSLSLLLALGGALQADPFKTAEISRAVNSVSLLQKPKATRSAQVGDTVTGEMAVKTGSDSRAELKFPDLTIMRLGANTFFSFETGGRQSDLEGGTMLFSAPKGEGGGQVQAGAVTAAVTGTNFLLSRLPSGDVKLVVLEGKVYLYFTKNPSVRRAFRAGQLVIVKSGATEIPEGVMIDLKALITTSRLLDGGGFVPLPVQALLLRVANAQQGHISPLPGTNITSQQNGQLTRRQTAGNTPPPSRPPQSHPDNRPPAPPVPSGTPSSGPTP